ncbi:MAG: PEP-CTERM sorting domain-containing protein [Phycisphaeraceae bacterium]
MPKTRCRFATATSLCAGVFATLSSGALVLHPADDPPLGLAKPADAVVGQWLGVNEASLVVIDPNFAITTKHQGGGIGTDVVIDGAMYKVADIVNHPTADLRVVRLETPGGSAANLSDFVGVYDQTDEVGQTAVLGGYGEVRGDDITIIGNLVGYEWAGDASRDLRWGANVIDSAGTAGANDVLLADFDSDADGVFGEATLAEGDSGGGVFLWDGTEWKVAALHRAVENNNQALFSATPELMDGVRLSSYHGFIDNAVPEPTSAALLPALAGLAARRRRR